MSATVFFDHEENSTNPTFKRSRVEISVDSGIILNRDRISLKCKVSDHLRNISFEVNAQPRNSFPLRICDEPVKSPCVEGTIGIANVILIVNFGGAVASFTPAGIDLAQNIGAAIFKILKRGEISSHGNCGSSHFSDEREVCRGVKLNVEGSVLPILLNISKVENLGRAKGLGRGVRKLPIVNNLLPRKIESLWGKCPHPNSVESERKNGSHFSDGEIFERASGGDSPTDLQPC